jgi:hypothetical protein
MRRQLLTAAVFTALAILSLKLFASEPVRVHRGTMPPPAVVRDHRHLPYDASQASGGVVVGHGPVIRDHRTPIGPIVRDHRTPTGPIVRDHRSTPVVRDHRH